jgi:hypothetical protein
MPLFPTQAWSDFQVNVNAPAPKLLDSFGQWITAGKPNDSKVNDLKPKAQIKGDLDPDVSPFVCSMKDDTGDRKPGSPPVPTNFWETSLIFLVDPKDGSSVEPLSSLTSGQEYYLAAVIGNRGQAAGGRYNNPPAPEIDASGIVMVWNTVDSPGVELPSLSNLDVNDKNPIYEQYFLNSSQYDVVGFRLNVQNVYNGIIKALNDAVANGLNLAGLTPDEWVKAQPAHLCAKVVARRQGQQFPNFGDSPLQNARIAQKNLAPFDVNLAVTEPDPNIVWKNFIVGDPFFLKIGEGRGRNTLILETKLPAESFRFFIAVPKVTFERFFHGRREGAVKGFKVVDPHELRLGERAKPFPEAVLLQYLGAQNALEIPLLGAGFYLGMSLGIEYSVKRLKAGALGEVTLVHNALIPKHVPEQITAGGFTILVKATNHRRVP